ncbi:MAG: hypothetical protein ABMB14_36535, partial [Myxococcota bacterium]
CEAELVMTLPLELKFGARATPIEGLGINFDFVYQGWNSIDQLLLTPQGVNLSSGPSAMPTPSARSWCSVPCVSDLSASSSDSVTSRSSRAGDSWPPKYDITLAGWLETIDLSNRLVYASGFLTLRRQYDTHGLWIGTLSNSQSDLVSASIAYLRKEGGLLDGWSRPHRVRIEAGASLLNPAFAASNGTVALDGSLQYAYDDRVSSDFPLRGRRLTVGFAGGGIPETPDTWLSAYTYGIQVGALSPRVAIAATAAGSVATSALPHRLLVLGGPSGLRSVPSLPACDPDADPDAVIGVDCLPVGTVRGVGAAEVRWAPIRGWSVPLGLAWGSEIQLSAGAVMLVARVDGDPAWGLGLTAGILGFADLLGAESTGLGLGAAWLVAGDGPAFDALLPASGIPELTLRFSQSF